MTPRRSVLQLLGPASLLGLLVACQGTNPRYLGASSGKDTDGGGVTDGTATLPDGGQTGDARVEVDTGRATDGARPGADARNDGTPPPGPDLSIAPDAAPLRRDQGTAAGGDGQTERMACGLNARGSSTRTCVGGRWQPFGDCVDPDICVDDQIAEMVCGLRGNGVQHQTCVHGQWSTATPCDDPDRHCVDGTVEAVTCGTNGRGTQTHTCVNGQFGGVTPCNDPDVCVDGSRNIEDCGLNGRGQATSICDSGQWGPFGDCTDPDACTDNTQSVQACPTGGEQVRTCVGGQFGDWSACPPPVADVCASPAPAAVGQTPGNLQATDQLTSSCNLGATGERVHLFTAPAAGVYTFRITAHAGEFSISLRSACNGGLEQACVVNGEPSLALSAGQQLYVVVEGTAGRTDYTLEIQATVVENSACNTPTPLANAGIDGQTQGPDTLATGCAPAAGPERVYVFVPQQDDLYTFSTAGTAFDTVLSLRRSCLDANSEFACQDDVGGNNHTSMVSAQLHVGDLIYVIVDGFGAQDAGPFHLQVTRPAALVDDAPMVVVPEGQYYRGATAANQPAAERPLRLITQHAFQIDTHEVTVAQYRQCVDAGRCPEPDNADGCNYWVDGRNTYPVNCLSWNEAENYCLQIGKRLPTESEWEKAARGGCETHGDVACDAATDASAYPWGMQPGPNCPRAWLVSCNGGDTAAVPATSPLGDSVYGVQDMAGNVSEATQDCYNETFYTDGPDTDPVYESPNCPDRTARGGDSHDNDWHDIRAARRISVFPADRILGVRCAR